MAKTRTEKGKKFKKNQKVRKYNCYDKLSANFIAETISNNHGIAPKVIKPDSTNSHRRQLNSACNYVGLSTRLADGITSQGQIKKQRENSSHFHCWLGSIPFSLFGSKRGVIDRGK